MDEDKLDRCIELARQYRTYWRVWFRDRENRTVLLNDAIKLKKDSYSIQLLRKLNEDFRDANVPKKPGERVYDTRRKHHCKMHTVEPDVSFWASLLVIAANIDGFNYHRPSLKYRIEEVRSALNQELKKILEEQKKKERQRKEQEKKRLKEEEQRRKEEERQRKKQEKKRLREERQKRRLVEPELKAISSFLQKTFLDADKYFHHEVKHVSEDEFEELKHSFVVRWCQKNLTLQLDKEQIAAVAAVNGNVRVTARAGSGKTRVLIARAIFLIKHCGIPPSKVLLLAFNKDAATEMKERLEEHLKVELPFVMTFHALAYSIVHPEESIVFDDPREGSNLSRLIQRVIDEQIRSANSPNTHGKQVQEFMLTHFRADWEQLIDGMYQLPYDEFMEFHYALPYNTIDGKEVKSFGEKLIGNTLFENAIEYKYEKVFYWDHGIYKPDFTIPHRESNGKKGIVIEYFGLDGDEEYDEMSNDKREYWRRKKDDWDFLEYTPDDINHDGKKQFADNLILQLKELGIESRKRLDEEIWEIIKERSLDEFTRTMQQFVSRCLNLDISPDKLDELIVGHSPKQPAEKQFLVIAPVIYREFLAKLKDERSIVFSSLVKEASKRIVDGQVEFCRDRGRVRGNLKEIEFVSIDEFQDFTPLFYEIIRALRTVNLRFRCFCVGDDWQLINSFAGSKQKYFSEFGQYFSAPKLLEISTNYRSPPEIVAVSNAVMKGRTPPAHAHQKESGMVGVCSLDEFRSRSIEKQRHGNSGIFALTLRWVKYFLDKKMDVAILRRMDMLPWYIDSGDLGRGSDSQFLTLLRSFLPEDDRAKVNYSTIHKFKGKQSPAVIVIDAVNKRYPKVHPTWYMFQIVGETLENIVEEERNIFYVGVSRAQKVLVLITENSRRSQFLDEIYSECRECDNLVDDLPHPPSLDGDRLEIRVVNAVTKAQKQKLRRERFVFEAEASCYTKTQLAEGFEWEECKQSEWVTNDIRIEVFSDEHSSDSIPLHLFDPPKVTIWVTVEYEDKKTQDQLKEKDFRWNPRKKKWYRMISEELFSADRLKSRSWFEKAKSIEVHDHDGLVIYSK